jgi:hypothetical protein
MKKNKGVGSIWVLIHIYIEMSQGNSLCSYLKQAKMSFFFLFFSSTKLENRRVEEVCVLGEVVEKGCRRVNMVQILCTYICRCKNDTC